jgi:hypothetical protein
MARKVVNRKELRAEAEAAEALEAAGGEAGKKPKAKAEKKAPVKRKSRSKTAEPERRKLFWGVFNQSAKRIALFDFSQRKAAEAKAAELTAGGKNQHFVMKVKEAVPPKRVSEPVAALVRMRNSRSAAWCIHLVARQRRIYPSLRARKIWRGVHEGG